MKLGELGSFGRVRVMSPRKLTSESTAAFELTDTYLGSNRAVCFGLDAILTLAAGDAF